MNDTIHLFVLFQAPSSTITVSERRSTTESPTAWPTHPLSTKAGATTSSTSAQTEMHHENHSHVFMPSTMVSTSRVTPPITSFPDRDMTELLTTKMLPSTEAETTPTPPIMTTTVYELTSSFTSVTPENTTLLFNHLLDLNSKPTAYLPNTSYQTAVPSWTTETEPSSLEPTEITTAMEPSFETSTSVTGKESEEHDVLAANVTKTAVVDVGAQKSSAVSWVVAIVAIIVLALLLLATSLFVLRYVKQSRKLHGKYNPAREEHALSTAFSMPMSHMSKDERLI
ncbi:hypothetical protein OESDEN_00654 [Oesophagostomum dentatum]|uniref:Uncharacterized protein n=1 Tax=Oesophagostomum dentatum TaxID=61180 RepID=A0A0B1TV85_OESDE|nr:hypothetical protein OESDEN_00654 [Oesophagostomum dentatum]